MRIEGIQVQGSNGCNCLCINKERLEEETMVEKNDKYYAINLDLSNKSLQYVTAFAGFEDGKEIRKIRPIKDPKMAVKNIMDIHGNVRIINTNEDALEFLKYGGNAIIKSEIYDAYFAC